MASTGVLASVGVVWEGGLLTISMSETHSHESEFLWKGNAFLWYKSSPGESKIYPELGKTVPMIAHKERQRYVSKNKSRVSAR